MKRSTAIFLQIVVILIGMASLALMLWEPQIEGRNAHATNVEIYFNDPFLAYAYIGSIPFFMVLYQASKVIRLAGQKKSYSQEAVNALRTIKYCAIIMFGFVAVGEIFIMLGDSDDRAGGVFMGTLLTFVSIVIATAASRFERLAQKAEHLASQ